jgi:hypothetical protein
MDGHWMNWDFFHWVADHVKRHDSHCNTFWCWPFWSLDFLNFEICFLWTLISLTYCIHLILHQLRAHSMDTSANMSVCLLTTYPPILNNPASLAPPSYSPTLNGLLSLPHISTYYPFTYPPIYLVTTHQPRYLPNPTFMPIHHLQLLKMM